MSVLRDITKQTPTSPGQHVHSRRLSIFCDLASGIEQDDNRSLPHIRTSSLAVGGKSSGTGVVENEAESPELRKLFYQQERCWKAMLLQPEDDIGLHGGQDEWSIVRERFTNARNKKKMETIQNA